MCCIWFAIVINKLFSITMVSTDKHYTINFLNSLYHLAYTLINSLYCLNNSVHNTCMSNHIRISKVSNYYIILS